MAKRTVKLGRPIRWTDGQLDKLSAIDANDIEAAAAWWQTFAPNRLKNILNASNTTDEVIKDAGTD
jgi:hypothetical protein